jgi:hypothetical protein
MSADDDVRAPQPLHDELAGREWNVRLTNGVPHVSNPVCDLNDEVVCRDGQFRWPWGTKPIDPAGAVPVVADRIMGVLRAVTGSTPDIVC